MALQTRKPRWLTDELTFAQIRDRLKPLDTELEEKRVGKATGGRFVRKLPDGKPRLTNAFFVPSEEWIVDASTVAKWASELDIDPEKLGVDDPWR